MRRAMVPAHAGVLSALGMLVTPPGRLLARTWLGPLATRSDHAIGERIDELAEEGRDALVGEGMPLADIRVEPSLDLRYRGQSSTLNLPWQGVEATSENFHRLHHDRYGHRLDVPVELVNLRVRVTVEPPVQTLPIDQSSADASQGGLGQVFGWDDPVPILSRESLPVKEPVAGPAVIVDSFATCWLAAGWTAWRDALGNLRLERRQESKG